MTTRSDCIVIAEDNAPYRRLLRIALEDLGLTIHTANDGLAAVEQTLRHRPSLTVVDVSMPTLSGLEAARTIRRTMGGAAPMLVALSALSDKRLSCIRDTAVFDAVHRKGKDIYATQAIIKDHWVTSLQPATASSQGLH